MSMPGRSTLKDSILEGYPKLRAEGHSPTEIASLYGVSSQYVYSLLGDVAALHGVTRDSLLIKGPYKTRKDKGVSKVKRGTNTMGKRQINKLTAKALYELTKRGYTLVDFCAKYHCDEIALKARIKRILHNSEKNANEAFNAILANSKKMNGAKSKTRVPSEIAEQVDEVLATGPQGQAAKGDEESLATAEDTELSSDDISVVPTAFGEQASSEAQDTREEDFLLEEATLEELQAELQLAQEIDVRLMREYAGYDRQFAQRSDAIISLEGKIEKLQEQIKQHEKRIAELAEDRDKLYQLRAEAYARRQNHHQQIETLNRLIRERTVAELVAFSRGNVEIAAAPAGFVLDESGTDELAEKMLRDAEFENLRVKDVRLLARIIQIAANSSYKVEVAFDDEALQEFYDGLDSGKMVSNEPSLDKPDSGEPDPGGQSPREPNSSEPSPDELNSSEPSPDELNSK